jgi:hypothetical protein
MSGTLWPCVGISTTIRPAQLDRVPGGTPDPLQPPPLGHRDRPDEHLRQASHGCLRELVRKQGAGVLVVRQPAHVHGQHRVESSDPLEVQPADRHASPATAKASASLGSILSSARTSITSPVPSASLAK